MLKQCGLAEDYKIALSPQTSSEAKSFGFRLTTPIGMLTYLNETFSCEKWKVGLTNRTPQVNWRCNLDFRHIKYISATNFEPNLLNWVIWLQDKSQQWLNNSNDVSTLVSQYEIIKKKVSRWFHDTKNRQNVYVFTLENHQSKSLWEKSMHWCK